MCACHFDICLHIYVRQSVARSLELSFSFCLWFSSPFASFHCRAKGRTEKGGGQRWRALWPAVCMALFACHSRATCHRLPSSFFLSLPSLTSLCLLPGAAAGCRSLCARCGRSLIFYHHQQWPSQCPLDSFMTNSAQRRSVDSVEAAVTGRYPLWGGS